jgi:hypothetical protein
MTLKEKFENVLHNWIDEDYNRQHVAEELEIDADEYAVGFADWIRVCKLKGRPYDFENTQELLVIYKEEKDL